MGEEKKEKLGKNITQRAQRYGEDREEKDED